MLSALASRAFAEGQPATYSVVLLHGDATQTQRELVVRAIRSGAASVGTTVASESFEAVLPISATRAGIACDEECLKKLEISVRPSIPLVTRLVTSRDVFTLRVRVGAAGREYSVIGPLPSLEEMARVVGRRVVSATGRITLRGEAGPNAAWYVDGTKVDPSRDVVVSPGLHVVRLGDGLGRRSMARVEVPAGETVTATLRVSIAAKPTSPLATHSNPSGSFAKRRTWMWSAAALVVAAGAAAAFASTPRDGATKHVTEVEITD